MFQRPLVAIDRSPSAAQALSLVAGLARGGGSVHVLHVNRMQTGGWGATELSDREADALVRDAVAQLHAEGVAATASVSRSTPLSVGQVVARVARDRQRDVIVLGSRRRRLPGGMVRGTRAQVTRHSMLPVLTAPPPLRISSGRLHRSQRGVDPRQATDVAEERPNRL